MSDIFSPGPKLLTALREPYGWSDARADLFAGLTVSVVALPLSLALAIASGVPPERGLFTAVIAGAVVSLLGGSRYQIAGPTGAFVVVVAGVVQRFGYQGLVAATVMAGVMLVAAAMLGLGRFIRYIPFPVVTGFTSAIAVVIFASQIGDMLGLAVAHAPADAVGRIAADAAAWKSFNPYALGVALGTLSAALAVQKFAPRLPAFLIAIVLASAAAWAFALPVTTIAGHFGGIPSALPAVHLPLVSTDSIRVLLPSAFTIFVLGGIESLLSAVVADGMTGGRHRPNVELAAQGVANLASAAMGGIPATGAIARTATNIRAGARTPVAGLVHSAAILLMMALFAPLAGYIPLPALGALLAIVCWNMAEAHIFAMILRGAAGERLVLVATFLLTIFVDLTVAIAAGIVLSALVFAATMAETATARVADETRLREQLPPGVEVFALSGPFFFAAVAAFEEVLSRSGGAPKLVILRLAEVPVIDSSGAATLKRLIARMTAKGTVVVLSEVNDRVMAMLRTLNIVAPRASSFDQALAIARGLAPIRG
jgi:SulP family sulfate permease